MDSDLTSIDNVVLVRRGYHISGTLMLTPHHVVFSFNPTPEVSTGQKQIWICYPVIEKLNKSRGSSWINNNNNIQNGSPNSFGGDATSMAKYEFDHYSASNIRIHCKDFTYYSFDFINDSICTEVYRKLSSVITAPKVHNSIREFYAFSYSANLFEQKLPQSGWFIYDPIREYKRQKLITDDEFWRISKINSSYKFCPSYPDSIVVPGSISDNVLKHAGKFRSKQRIPAIVYKHRAGVNGNVIARCLQPLVGLNLQNRSIQDERLIAEIFETQSKERTSKLSEDNAFKDQPQRNLIVDLRPITNAMAQHALGAGTENIDNYRGKIEQKEASQTTSKPKFNVDKIFGNIDNIHVMRDSYNKLTTILSDLDKYPVSTDAKTPYPLLQQALTKTQWLHRLSIILQSVDRITKSVHLNNTNVVIHCSDGWDRTSQVSALAQLCLDPYYRTIEGFMVLIEKEWVSFGFKFATRGDHGGCVGALMPKKKQQNDSANKVVQTLEAESEDFEKSGGMSAFLKKAARAANHIKTTAQNAANNNGSETDGENVSFSSTYNGLNEKSPVFHQFLDCIYQIYRQHPDQFEFNSRFLKRLLYHYFSCQYGTFLCDSEIEAKKVQDATVSVWDYFNSRPAEFKNKAYKPTEPSSEGDDSVVFFNYTDVKWWSELYSRSDEEMNGLSNSLDRKFAQMKLATANQ